MVHHSADPIIPASSPHPLFAEESLEGEDGLSSVSEISQKGVISMLGTIGRN
jgi:hypothetical protein